MSTPTTNIKSTAAQSPKAPAYWRRHASERWSGDLFYGGVSMLIEMAGRVEDAYLVLGLIKEALRIKWYRTLEEVQS